MSNWINEDSHAIAAGTLLALSMPDLGGVPRLYGNGPA